MTELSVQDEEFLEDIEGLSEEKKNGIIAYVRNKLEAVKQENKEFLEAKKKELKDACNSLIDPEHIAAYGKDLKERMAITSYVRDWFKLHYFDAVLGGEGK